jgi:hypothetical protein
MALNTRTSLILDAAKLDGTKALYDSGWIDIYDSTGGGQPATPETSEGTNVLIVSLRFGATAFPAAVGRVATANPITSGTAIATKTATWCRITESDHTTVLEDGSVGTATSNIVLNAVDIVTGATVSCSSFTRTSPMQGA